MRTKTRDTLANRGARVAAELTEHTVDFRGIAKRSDKLKQRSDRDLEGVGAKRDDETCGQFNERLC